MASSRKPGGDEEGVVLLVVVWVLTLLSLLILSWAKEQRTELMLSTNYRDASRCRHLAEGGIYYAIGKMVAAKAAERSGAAQQRLGLESPAPDTWRADQTARTLELPGGVVEIRVADEAGKINLNLAEEQTLTRLFVTLGYNEADTKVKVDSILDWRSSGDIPRPFGAKSSYYLSLDPPYPAKGGKFETVEELAWVRGFAGDPRVAALGDLLTAQEAGRAVNVNTARVEVLEAMGLPPDMARTVVVQRQAAPIIQVRDLMRSVGELGIRGQRAALSTRSSPFITIKATGMLNNKKGRHTTKAVVRVDFSLDNFWEIFSWTDDFPG